MPSSSDKTAATTASTLIPRRSHLLQSFFFSVSCGLSGLLAAVTFRFQDS